MATAKKTAVVLFNLGGPDCKEAIRPFLINFFMDKNIITAPWPVRFFVSRLIAWKRTKNEAGASYGILGDKSPLLENTQAQADALQAALGDNYRTFVCMRYWHPMTDEVVKQVAEYAPDHVVLLPLYPQYSTTTTRSSLQQWSVETKRQKMDIPTSLACCYPYDNGFISASADLVRSKYQEMSAKIGRPPRVLFSAHGLPEKIVAAGDPYQWQCEESARKIAAATGIEELDWSICYQSRVGPLKWIGPSTEQALEKAAADKVPVLIYPHAFVSEHVETLVEIDIEYRELASHLGVPAFDKVTTVGTHPLFINGLADIVRRHETEGEFPHPSSPRICPAIYDNCCHNCIKL